METQHEAAYSVLPSQRCGQPRVSSALGTPSTRAGARTHGNMHAGACSDGALQYAGSCSGAFSYRGLHARTRCNGPLHDATSRRSGGHARACYWAGLFA